MTEDIKNKLLMCAEVYHCAGFIASDPVQFPHRYTLKQDIEISGLLTAIMSFGNRKQILKKADELHKLMGTSPIVFIGCCRMLIFMDTSVGYIRPIRSSEVWKML